MSKYDNKLTSTEQNQTTMWSATFQINTEALLASVQRITILQLWTSYKRKIITFNTNYIDRGGMVLSKCITCNWVVGSFQSQESRVPI